MNEIFGEKIGVKMIKKQYSFFLDQIER